MADERDHPLRPLTKGWLKKIKRADEHKKVQFGDDAQEAMNFFNGPVNFFWEKEYMGGKRGFLVGDDEETLPAPSFRMCVNKVAELVQIMGPNFYHHNPKIVVTTYTPPGPPMELFVPPPPTGPIDPAQGMMLEQQMMMGQQQFAMVQQQQHMEQVVNGIRASLLDYLLNYTQQELDKKSHGRKAIVEAIIKGMGVLWTEVYEPYPGGPQM